MRLKKPIIPANYKKIAKKVNKVAEKNGFKIYIVGGFVRDLLCGKIPDDMDLLVDGPNNSPAIELGEILRINGIVENTAVYDKTKVDGLDFGVFKAEINGEQIDLVMPRGESYNSGSRRPCEVHKTSIFEDAIRRDFTVNTLLYDISEDKVLDPTGLGIQDLKNLYIRSANPDPQKMIDDDPLRILRAIRFATTKKMKIVNMLFASMKVNSHKLRNTQKLSWERIRDELTKILMSSNVPSSGIRLIDELGVLDYILPELDKLKLCSESSKWHKKESTFEHTLRALDKAAKIKSNALVRWAVLLHDTGKPNVQAPHKTEPGRITFYGHEQHSGNISKVALKRFKFPVHETEFISSLVSEHMFYHHYSEKTSDKSIRKHLYRLVPKNCRHEELRFTEILFQQLEASLLLAESDKRGSGKWIREDELKLAVYRKKLINLSRSHIPLKSAINGIELMDMFDAPSGAWLKEVMEVIHDHQLGHPDADRYTLLKVAKSIVATKYPEYFLNYKKKNASK